jgi:hypothetical protein
MARTELFCGTGNFKVFPRMVQPNVNVRQIDMSQVTDRVDMKSLTNAIGMDTMKNSEIIPNLAEKLSYLPYNFVMMFRLLIELSICSMLCVHDGVTHKKCTGALLMIFI